MDDRWCERVEERVAGYVARLQLLRRGERALLLLSGGPDSMALLRLVAEADRRLGLGLELAALHVDYATRGADSARDRDIVVRACDAAGVPLHVVRLGEKPAGGDFQARARRIRYDRARTLQRQLGYSVLVTGHNRDDQAETVLYRLVKYASLRGLAGMRPRDGDVARPLLCLGAGEVREYCRRRGIECGEDVTNLVPVYARNLLRLEVLPRLARLNPRVADTLVDLADLAAEQADLMEALAAQARERVLRAPGAGDGGEGGEVVIDLAALAAEPPAVRAALLHDLLRERFGGGALVSRRLVRALEGLAARGDDAGRLDLGRGIEAVRGGGELRLRRAAAPHRCAPLVVTPEAVAAAGDGLDLAFCGRRLRLRLLPGAVFEREAARRGEAFVALAAPRRLVLRHPVAGDRFTPLGLGSDTSLLRHLARARVPAAARPLALVLEVDGRVAWVGYEGGRGWRGRVAAGSAVVQSSPWTLHLARE